MEQLVDDEEIPIPLKTSLVGHNLIYHHDHDHNHNLNTDHEAYNKEEEECVNVVLYKECLKNHAASSGGNAIDGCGEFMPISSNDPFTCSACNCHRNFHRRIEFGPRRLVLGHQMIMPYNNHQKRFRTKFTQEQKERMVRFADKIGWKIQKQEESVIQHFCQQIGVKRRVLKVWMHNNKHKYYRTSNTNSIVNA